MKRYVLVYGAYGHTGRFVVAELLRQGLTPILSGRDSARLGEMAGQFPGLEVRAATVGDSHSLDSAVRGAAVVVNCAGPFLDTAVPVAAAAVRAGAHYLDVTAEQAGGPSRCTGLTRSWHGAPTSPSYRRWRSTAGSPTCWRPTPRLAGKPSMRSPLRSALTGGGRPRAPGTPAVRNTRPASWSTAAASPRRPARRRWRDWEFPPPLERQTVAGTPFAEIITIARHLAASKNRHLPRDRGAGGHPEPRDTRPPGHR